MSLDWSIRRVDNWQQIVGPEGRTPHPMGGWVEGYTRDEVLTTAIVFATLLTGVPSITKDNWAELLRRIRVIEQELGIYYWYTEDGNQPIPADAIERRIGLYTNASRKTKREFDRDVARIKAEKAREKARAS